VSDYANVLVKGLLFLVW